MHTCIVQLHLMKLVFRTKNLRMSSFVEICRRCLYFSLRIVAWVPVLFVTALLLWGYYVYVYIIHLSGEWSGGGACRGTNVHCDSALSGGGPC